MEASSIFVTFCCASSLLFVRSNNLIFSHMEPNLGTFILLIACYPFFLGILRPRAFARIPNLFWHP
jgi:hypothetical protein